MSIIENFAGVTVNPIRMTSSKTPIQFFFLLPFLFLALVLKGQNGEQSLGIHSAIQHRTDEIFESLVEIRRDFHRFPELSGQEQRTSEKVADYLRDLGLEVHTHVGGYGVVGILKGKEEGKKIAWRADMDAMPSDAPDLVDLQSQNEGVRHICGHDVHTAIALGIANVLASQKDRLHGTVYFVFQPSEENIKGAKAMVEDGLFDLIDPEEFYALHMSPFPVGTIATKGEFLFSDYKKVSVALEKGGGHDTAVDFVQSQILSVQNVDSADNFNNPMNWGDPVLGITYPKTLYQDYIFFNPGLEVEDKGERSTVGAYMSCSNRRQLEQAQKELEQKILHSEKADLKAEIAYAQVSYTIHNDEQLTEGAIESISSIYGQESVIRLHGVIPGGRSDDFALFQEEVPGVYFFLGGSNMETGVNAMPHAPDFAVDEDCIKTGVYYFSSLIVESLGGED